MTAGALRWVILLGPLTIGGNLSQSYNMTSYQWSYGWGVSAGLGIGNDKGGIGINVSYGSGGWGYGIGGSYYTDYERAYMRADARNRRNIDAAFDNYEANRDMLSSSIGAKGDPSIIGLPNLVTNVAKYRGKFNDDAPLYEIKGLTAGFTMPWGIYVGDVTDIHWVRHEYGHYLQAEQVGSLRYFIDYAIPSAKNYKTDPENHRYFWTEIDANYRSWEKLGRPSDWNTTYAPLFRRMSIISAAP
jgi:hypothetical protein